MIVRRRAPETRSLTSEQVAGRRIGAGNRRDRERRRVSVRQPRFIVEDRSCLSAVRSEQDIEESRSYVADDASSRADRLGDDGAAG